MPCIDPDGKLTASAEQMLRAMEQPVTLEELAERTGLALYRVRSGVREIVAAGLAEENELRFVLNEKGRQALVAKS